MNKSLVICCCVTAGLTAARGADDFLDRFDESLTWTASHDNVRAHVSGSLDLEAYTFQHPAPGLIHSDSDSLFNPRLSLFLDAQLGPQVYAFIQSRLDRGFDPGQGGMQWRIDEYALRFTPRADGVFNFQVGKFGTVVGNWVARHDSWDNPFITAPLPYENLTGIFDSAAAGSAAVLLNWAHLGPAIAGTYFDEYRLPILWGPSYASGAAVSGVIGWMDYALEMKNAALSSRPASWNVSENQWQHPAFAGRLGFRPDASWYLGFSGSTGTYLNSSAQPTLAPGYSLGDYREVVWGQDVSFAWHHVQIWAEAYEAGFEIPRVGRARTIAWYLEAKYKFTPQFAGAMRWNQQLYGDIPDGAGGMVQWGRDVWRLDLAPYYRFTPYTELKLQYSLQSGGIGPRDRTRMLAAQFITRF
jgi:hypothetical protein